jgi:hypothetical protein
VLLVEGRDVEHHDPIVGPSGKLRTAGAPNSQLVVLANGEIRVPESTGLVAHGHRDADQQIKIVMPANRNWVLVEVEVDGEEPVPPSIASKMPK